MLDKRSLIPLLSKPEHFGQPYHGLVRDGVLTLSNGKTLDVPWGWGDCYVLRVPGVAGQGVQMTPVEAAQEAAAGRQWLDYAMLVGRQRTYAGSITVGANAWLYAAPDGTVWRIECDRLDTTDIIPSYPVAPLRYGHYPATLDFTFKIQRFGVISPGAETAPISTRTIIGQSIGPAEGWQSDWFYDYPERNADDRRRFPGDGRQMQWMPINIDDINSDGSRVLICINRSREQQMWSEPFGRGRAYPLAWVEVSVGGGATADSITISMSLVRIQLLDAFTDDASVVTELKGGFSATVTFVTTNMTPQHGGSEVTVGVDQTMQPLATDNEVGCLALTYAERRYDAGRCAGGYYDNSDVLTWVESGPTHSQAVMSAGADVEFTLISSRYEEPAKPDFLVGGPWSCLAYIWWVDWTGRCAVTWTVDASCRMGPHSLQLPPFVFESSVIAEDGWIASQSLANPGGVVSSPQVSPFVDGRVTMTSVFGSHEISGSGASGFVYGVQRQGISNGWYVTMPSPMPVRESGGGIRHGLQLRPGDNVYLVRVSNKVYAVLAEMDENQFASGQKIIAVGTPQGWTMINQSDKSDIGCAYNPVTGQLVTALTGSVGWI